MTKFIDVECKEYGDIEDKILLTIPAQTEWPNDKLKRLCILEDIEYSRLTKVEHANLARLFGFVSSHKFLSMIATCQDSYS